MLAWIVYFLGGVILVLSHPTWTEIGLFSILVAIWIKVCEK